MEDWMDAIMPCIMLEVSMLLNMAAMGMPMSIPAEAMAMDFHAIDNSLDSSESFWFFNDAVALSSLLLSCSTINPSNNLSANISAS